MLPAVLASFLFAFSAVVSQRASRIFGALPANFYRLCIACLILGLITWTVDVSRGVPSLHDGIFQRFFWSGLVGYGIGDIALFLAYARLGSRLTILINWCAASITSAAGDYWLRQHFLTWPQWIGVGAVMMGLCVALWPADAAQRVRHPAGGVLFAIIAGAGMGIGTVLSSQAIDAATTLGVQVHGFSQAFQRSTAGLGAALLAFLCVKYLPQRPADDRARKWKHKPFWIISTALCGPVLGVSCYQWALSLTGSSTIVVAIAATSTLLVIPLARLMEKDKPGGRQIAGTILAAAGVIALKWFS